MPNRHLSRFLLAAAACGVAMLAWGAEGPQRPASSAAADATSSGGGGAADASAADAMPSAQAKQYWGFLKQYCSKCHNTDDWAGGIAFETMSPQNIPEDAKTWEMAINHLSGHLMPPPGNPQPPQVTVDQFVHWLGGDIDQAAEGHPYTGSVALHRLNRKEYANAVWDLLRVKVDPDRLLPKDDEAGGYDNIANVLQVSSSFLGQYLSAAREVAIEAVGNRDATSVGTQYHAGPESGSQFFHEPGLPLGTRGGFQVTHDFPADGEYELNIGNLAAALWVFNQEFENRIIATYDGTKFWEGVVGGEKQIKAIDQRQDPAVDAINATLKHIRFHATAGPHQIAVTFIHRDFAESEGRLELEEPGDAQDEVLRIASFEVLGPLKVTGLGETPSRERIFTCMPTSAQEQQPCAEQIISRLAREAYRRPVTSQDLDPLYAIYAAGAQHGGFEEGIRRAITAILASPFFLYRAEPTPLGVKAGASYRITDLELASRLSFFLWSSVPDNELLTLASQNRLHEPAVLQAQVYRMLADPRAISLASNFAFQWLDVDRLSEVNPDPKIFPYVRDPRDDFRTELKLFVNSIFRGNQDVVDLLTANYTFLNQRLALLYGINDVRGNEFRRVTLTPAESVRYGLLGKGAFLMGTSYPNRTAPVLRGQWILDRITGTPPDPPPPGVKMTIDVMTPGSDQKVLTVREQMAAHRNNPRCFSCHGLLDPLGLAFENFDAVGRWRTRDRLSETPVDATGVLPGGIKVNGPDDVRRILLEHPAQFVQSLTENLMTFAIGRTLDYRDMPEVRDIVRASAKDDYRFWSLVMGIVASPQFQERSAPAATPHTMPVRTAQLIR
ncbi:MAG TPA: DUF1592 domain-containing protein [Steroidobacteraceae bacterium]|nr:DUF1592 domain-containing protein [Steroidobacteraceae bacterium]